MIEFKVVTTPKPDRFETEITKMLNDGWELQGPTSFTQNGMMAQSLTRETKEVPKKVSVSKKVNPEDAS